MRARHAGWCAFVILLPINCPLGAATATQPAIQWQKWSDDVFERAKKENKFVLMDLEAVWCHWCHVMDEVTYRDPKVAELLASKYIAVKVDQDSRPDLSNRYEDYGWPATIIFNADGGEIAKRRGYIAPGPMARLLQAVIDDPTPGPSVEPEEKVEFGSASALPQEVRKELEEKFVANYDDNEGGWGTIHKYLDWDAIEYSTNRARAGDKDAERRARQTLTAALKLIDPAWGGIYQYSTDGDWDHPHFEKIMQFQAEALQTYSHAYAQWHDPAYLNAARAIRGYLKTFLTSPDGAFYTSQNADLIDGQHGGEYFALDDNGRRKLGVPRVDTHVYSRENGWAIQGLAALYAVTDDEQILQDAVRAANWIVAHRSIEGGGFRHDETDAAGPYLADTLSMARAFLALYAVTGERTWLARASSSAQFIANHFKSAGGSPGFVTAAGGGPLAPKPEVDENVSAVRFFNLLSRYTGKDEHRAFAGRAMRYLATAQIARSRGAWGAGVLLADAELSREPLHVTIVGRKDDAAARELFVEAVKSPVGYKRVEWWDAREGPMPNPDVKYPQTKKPSAFLCTGETCSPPISKPEALARKLQAAATH